MKKKKHHFLSTLCSFEKEKKHPDFLPIFPDFNSIFQTFCRSGKLLCELQNFFQEFIKIQPLGTATKLKETLMKNNCSKR